MDLINNGIIWSTIVNACKHIKIFYAQLKVLKVYLDTCNIENSLHLNLGANNPQIVSSYKPNIHKIVPHVLSTILVDFWPPFPLHDLEMI